MLAREGYALPEFTRMQDKTETPRVMVSPDSNAGPLILGGLQNSLGHLRQGVDRVGGAREARDGRDA